MDKIKPLFAATATATGGRPHWSYLGSLETFTRHVRYREMRLRNTLCWLVYNFDLGPFGPWILDLAFGGPARILPDAFTSGQWQRRKRGMQFTV
jgi:hypothetical protein